MIGKKVSHYEILEKLGEGGMGVVYKAHDTRLDRTVALKFLPSHLTVTDEDRERFIREAKATAALNHPHICTVYSVEEHDGQQFISMEYVDGVTLREKIRLSHFTKEEVQGGLSVDKAITLSIQIAEALQQAHKKDIVHRDIKPENIMVTEDDRMKVMDFGLAKLKGAENLTKSRSTVGTLGYMSPEQIQGGDVDHRSDIFSFGVVLYEMLTGQNPFRGEHEAAMVYSIVNETPKPVQTYVPDASAELDHIINRMLEKDPAERYQQVNELIVDLKKIKREIISSRVSQKQSISDSGKSVSQKNNSMKTNSLRRPALFVILFVFMLFIAIYHFTAEKRSGADDQQSIAVLPFENLSPDPQDAYFADGVHENIIIHLSRISGMSVIARSSVLPFRPGERNIKNIANNLNVTAVLEGNIRRAGGIVRISVQLIDPFSNQTMWADIYDRDVTDIFAIQSEIARKVADALKIQITSEEERAIDRGTTDNLEAYRLYMQGRSLLGPRREQTMRQAVTLFQRALVLDSEFAAAWAGLADALTYLETFGFATPDINIGAEEAAERSLELDPDLAEAHFALSNLAHARRNNSEAIARSERAIELRPSYADAYNLLSWIHKLHGSVEDAIATAMKAVEFDPLGSAPQSNLALSSLAEGNLQKAVTEARMIQELHPEFPTGTFIEALALYRLGEFSKAKLLLQNLSVDWAPSGTKATLALVELALDNTEAAHKIMEEIDPEHYLFSVALIHAALGELETANSIITSIQEWDYWSTLAYRYIFHDVLEPIRQSSHHDEILKRIHFSWGVNGKN